jgi:D-serine deaminase-like pyridoxal phosphate-dependent protein
MVGAVDRLRPHIKTNKSPDAVRLMLHAGITKFKCATIAEAELLGIVEAPDVLLAYQPLGPKLERFARLIKKFPKTKFSCLADNMDAALEQDDIFSSNSLQVSIYIDLNVGMNRTGIVPGDEAVELCKYCSTAPGLSFAGLHAYDGHLRHADVSVRKKQSDEAFETVEKLQEQLIGSGINIPAIIAGGSPTFPIHALRKKVECSPGTFVYWDKTYLDQCPEQNFLPAALLVTRIISLPTPTRICTDLGHKSVASENELTRRIYFLNATGLTPVGHSEEHLVLESERDHHFKVGDVLYGIPYHVCPTVALYETAITVENGKIIGEWKTLARDRRLSI